MKIIKKVLQELAEPKKEVVERICQFNNLKLDFGQNKSEITILKEVFEERSYSDYFPFYKKATILDVGAHYGYFSLFALRNTHPDSTILSFEPASENYQQLKKNLSDNNAFSVKIHNCAIGDRVGKIKLSKNSNATHTIIERNSSTKINEQEEVRVLTIKSVVEENHIGSIDFLKLDCEGAEYKILEKLEDDIYKIIKVISLEFHDLKDEKYTAGFLQSLLEKKNFKVVKCQYSRTTMGLNYGKLVAVNINARS